MSEELTDEQKQKHDQATASMRQGRKGMSDTGLLMQGVATLMLQLIGEGSKYGLAPADTATMAELFSRADPSSGW